MEASVLSNRRELLVQVVGYMMLLNPLLMYKSAFFYPSSWEIQAFEYQTQPYLFPNRLP